jgi:3-hydroxyisobutyrate dehydrogenase-like beta-hydroxyacid dehydrogenase
MSKIGFIGLGKMGAAMATNLIKAGHELTVYNRSPEKAEPLVKLGATRVERPDQVVQSGGVVMTMLTDDKALDEISWGEHGFGPNLGPGVHVSHSTIGPDTARRLAERHREQGGHYVACPVFGKPEAAEAAKLWIATSGGVDAKRRIASLLVALGQGSYDFGTDEGAAHVVKLAGNFMFAAAIEAMGEAFTLAQQNGVERQQIYKMFSETLFNCPAYKAYGSMIASEHYQPVGAPPALIRKDVRLVQELALSSNVPMPLANLIQDRLTSTIARGDQDIDWCGFAREISRSAGL